ncbi:MAG: thioredoxin-disulfide reductase [Anaerolineaceae bacterium]|nr:thioredoxin-disulfide reductase [Anaerolineaceae bacterium]
MDKEHRKLIILGSGPAGLAAAIYAARAELNPLVFTGMVLYGQASTTETIENYPGFPKGIGGNDLGQLFQVQAERFGAQIEYAQVDCLNLRARPFEVSTYGKEYTADAIILATGADNRKLDVPGEIEFVGRGVSYCATCDGWFYKDKDIHVVGGGDSALEEALFLTRFARSITIIHRRDTLRAGAILENRARNNPKIRFMWNSVVRKIGGEEKVKHLELENLLTKEKQTIPTDGLFIFIGHTPNSGLFKDQVSTSEDGTVIVDQTYQTSIKGVFAAGEICDPHFRQVITSAGMGASAAISAVKCLEQWECGA